MNRYENRNRKRNSRVALAMTIGIHLIILLAMVVNTSDIYIPIQNYFHELHEEKIDSSENVIEYAQLVESNQNKP